MDAEKIGASFLSSYKDAKIELLHDVGMYRHVRISGAHYYRFELMTWPGSLSVNCEGDEFLFTRTTDMFDFFRRGAGAKCDAPNFAYWAEKLSDPRSRKVRAFDYSAFERDVESVLSTMADASRVEEIRDDLQSETCESDENSCREFLSRHAELLDLSIDGRWEDWTYRYAYACFAILHGIREYDRVKTSQGSLPLLDGREHHEFPEVSK
ncbi:hypothetical+protein [Methylocapsa aurea]|uniref:hypothetical protein n=1 Tax=Methylocapsa aurea TaxID=663610 RepID=UPI003D18FBD0